MYISLILEFVINMKRMLGCGLNLSGSGPCPVSGSCEHDPKISGSIQYGEFGWLVERLSTCEAIDCYIGFLFGATASSRPGSPHSRGFLDHTWRTTVGRTPLDEWSASRRNLYLTTHNTHNRRTSMPPVGFEPTISAAKLPQTARLLGSVLHGVN